MEEEEVMRGSPSPSKPELKLEPAINYASLAFPMKTRAMTANSTDCTCDICKVATAHVGAGFNRSMDDPWAMGKPKGQGPKPLAMVSPRPWNLCHRCLQPVGRGINHPQPCNIRSRRENMESLLQEDPRGAEIAAANLVKQKLDESSGSQSSLQLSTAGRRPINVQKLEPADVKRQLFQEEPISAASVQELISGQGLSLTKTEQTLSWIRSKRGRDTFEPYIMDKLRLEDKSLEKFFTWEYLDMDAAKKEDRKMGKVIRPVAYCHDLDGLLQHLRNVRGFEPQTEQFVKIGIASGGKFIKVCLNLEKVPDESSSPAFKKISQKKNFSYAQGIFARQFKDSGVKALIILGIVEDVNESYDNIKMLMNKTGIPNIDYMGAYDMKLALTALGLGPASSTHSCPWCNCPSKMFKDHLFTGGELRTFNQIKKNAEEYQLKLASWKGKTKASSKDQFNCEHEPLILPKVEGDNDVTVIDYVPPMELHLTLGICNDLYKNLEKELAAKKTGISLTAWSHKLGCVEDAQFGGQFNGNQCVKLLKNLHVLETILEQNDALDAGKPFLEAFEAFNLVRESCFGQYLDDKYKGYIRNFGWKYFYLSENKLASITPKVHAVCVHVEQFLERQKRAESLDCALGSVPAAQRGLGYWSEQASESVHSNFNQLWEGGKYKRKLILDDPEKLEEYAKQFFKCLTTYNARHQNPVHEEIMLFHLDQT